MNSIVGTIELPTGIICTTEMERNLHVSWVPFIFCVIQQIDQIFSQYKLIHRSMIHNFYVVSLSHKYVLCIIIIKTS
jgi:hypothetical protein